MLPCAQYELASFYTKEKNYADAKHYLHKASSSYKDYELENRIQVQMKSLQKRLKYLTDLAAGADSAAKS